MKRFTALFFMLIALTCVALLAQGPGGQRGGGRGGRGFAAPPPATGPVADATNKIVEAINKQDATFFDKALTSDAILADEDGHVGLPARIWVQRLTSSPKKLAIEGLRVGELADGGWAVFSYTLDEMTAQGTANQMKGTTTIVYKKNGADLQAALVHLAVNGRAITPH